MSYFSYIGDIDDPDFFWDKPEDAPKGGNLPNRVAPPERWDSLGVGYDWISNAIENGRYEGRQLDWGAWGLKMTGAEIQALLPDAEDAIKLAALDPAKTYVLIVAENA